MSRNSSSEGEPAKARELAQRGLAAFPNSVGGAMCFNLIQQIEAKSARLQTENIWNAPWPTLDVTYRNVTKVYFRAVPIDFSEDLPTSLDRFDEGHLRELLKAKPALEWAADLPSTQDFKERTERLTAPGSLKPGFYFIIAGHDRAFRETDNQVGVAPIWVSDLAMVLQLRHDGRAHSGLVVKATSGEPVSGASVRIWHRIRTDWSEAGARTKTDENGKFEFSATNEEVFVLAEKDGQAVSNTHEIYSYGERIGRPSDPQIIFFTDRAIYRPGQTINYKGVAVRFDQDAGKYSALAGDPVTVVFNDHNGKEIARATHQTNDYGSFSGVFTAPRDRVTGLMRIQVIGQPSGDLRPRGGIQTPEIPGGVRATRRGGQTGRSGPNDGESHCLHRGRDRWSKGKMAGRTQRSVSRLVLVVAATFRPSHRPWHRSTEPDGIFKIQFTAEPDRAVPAKNEPVFVFAIHADVTDTTGETRSENRRCAPDTPHCRRRWRAGEWQTPDKPVEFTIETNSLDGDPQPASGGSDNLRAQTAGGRWSARPCTARSTSGGVYRNAEEHQKSTPPIPTVGTWRPGGDRANVQDRRHRQDGNRRVVESGHLPCLPGDKRPVWEKSHRAANRAGR